LLVLFYFEQASPALAHTFSLGHFAKSKSFLCRFTFSIMVFSSSKCIIFIFSAPKQYICGVWIQQDIFVPSLLHCLLWFSYLQFSAWVCVQFQLDVVFLCSSKNNLPLLLCSCDLFNLELFCYLCRPQLYETPGNWKFS
jgi:hypothetical protein